MDNIHYPLQGVAYYFLRRRRKPEICFWHLNHTSYEKVIGPLPTKEFDSEGSVIFEDIHSYLNQFNKHMYVDRGNPPRLGDMILYIPDDTATIYDKIIGAFFVSRSLFDSFQVECSFVDFTPDDRYGFVLVDHKFMNKNIIHEITQSL